MDNLVTLLPIVDHGITAFSLLFLFRLWKLEADSKREFKNLSGLTLSMNERIKRIELFLDKRFSFNSIPGGYK